MCDIFSCCYRGSEPSGLNFGFFFFLFPSAPVTSDKHRDRFFLFLTSSACQLFLFICHHYISKLTCFMLPSSYIRNTCDFLIKEARRFFFLAMLLTLGQGVILFDSSSLMMLLFFRPAIAIVVSVRVFCVFSTL